MPEAVNGREFRARIAQAQETAAKAAPCANLLDVTPHLLRGHSRTAAAWLWRADVDRCGISRHAHVLTDRELQAADRMRRKDFRDTFIVTRALLRRMLGIVLETEPHAVEIGYGPWGKPILGPSAHQPYVHFNIAHAGGIALIGVAWGGRIGVDVETIRAGLPLRQMAEQVFSDAEQAFLRSRRYDPNAFFALWTRKEAILKALGGGFSDEAARVCLMSTYRSNQKGLQPDACHDGFRTFDVHIGHSLKAAAAFEDAKCP